MDEYFTKFNSNILDRIYTFVNSPSDLLYISGFQGCGKSEIVNLAVSSPLFDNDILLFRHLCFENSAIDDFLLGFYDTLRFYSINKKINLKKSLSENFAQKVSFYFKNLDKKCLIIIDNFDVISENSEIMDFLGHLGKFENVKLILISREENTGFFEEKGLDFETVQILPNDYETFRLKVEDSVNAYDERDIEDFYNATKGYELYFKMAARYIKTVNTTLKEFMEEFKKRNLEFDDFLLSKIVSLVPPVYLPFLQNMSCITHSVKIDFIEHYRLGDISLINYLNRKMLLSRFGEEIYLKDYLKRYFLGTLSIKEKINNYKNLIEIYEAELAKSPKERLLRLSRESIRKQIEFVKTQIPDPMGNSKVSAKNITDFSYSRQAASSTLDGVSSPMPWYLKLAGEGKKKFQEKSPSTGDLGLSEEEIKLIKDFRKNKAKNPQEKEIQPVLSVDEILTEAKNLKKKYDFNGAIECLKGAFGAVLDEDSTKKIYTELAENYAKINDFSHSLENFEKASNLAKNTGDEAGFIDIKQLEAGLYRKLYRFGKAKECLNEALGADNGDISASITKFKNKPDAVKNAAARAFLEYGEIYESENDVKNALQNYLLSLDIIDKEGDMKLVSNIYFKIALLYDDGESPENALKYYDLAIQNAENSDSGSDILSTSYTNRGVIYAELWGENGLDEDFSKSVENFKNAVKIDLSKENAESGPNYAGIYFAGNQLARLLRDRDSKEALKYLNLALEASIKLDDAFKTAISYLEKGDYYYHSSDNQNALRNYLEARKAIGKTVSEENNERISVRINDMRIRMEENEFQEILKEYE